MKGFGCSSAAILAVVFCLSRFHAIDGQLSSGCTDTYCQNGGTCSEHEILSFTLRFCSCTSEYDGPTCENLRPCGLSPCQNGGTCENNDDGESRTCLCPDNTSGVDCETVIDVQCGINPAVPGSPRFFGGSEAPLGKWPWQGYIKLYRGNSFGATLISPQYAVTSGGALNHVSTKSAIEKLVFGDTYQGDDESLMSDYRQYAYVEKITNYPGANWRLADGDATLIKFTEPLEINDFVRPICLPSPDMDELEDYDMCYNTGWGLNENFEFNSYLKEGRVTVVDPETCSNIFRNESGLVLPNENMICTQQVDSSEGPCVGDGGNAMACVRDGVWELVGTLSWGYACGGDLPFVNWRTSAFLDSINYVVFDGPEADICEPIELEECAPYLPFPETFVNQQDQVLYPLSLFLEVGASSPYCDLGELKELLCVLNLGQCGSGDEAPPTICRPYCEAILELCHLDDTDICVDLPYGADHYQKWCTKGKDYSCGNHTIYLEAGTFSVISSPLYSYGYPELRNCLWEVHVPEGHVIGTKFSYMGISTDGDFLTFGEGDPRDLTSVVERFDGDVAPPLWASSSNEMWIGFQSNNGEQGHGFEFFLVAIPEDGRECREDDFYCDDTCRFAGIRCDYITDCLDGGDEAGCNEVSVAEEGTVIVPPLYPYPGYPPNFDFTWNLEVPEGYLVGLSFYDLDLDYGGKDYVLVGEGRDGSKEDALYYLNGTMPHLRILPFASSIWVRLITDDVRSGGSGFVLNATRETEKGECWPYYEFDCEDGLCLSGYAACDGIVQCASGIDEDVCSDYCPAGYPIPPEERCNGMYYCHEGEDEEDCELAHVGDTWYFKVPRNEENPLEYISNSTRAWIVRAEEGLGFEVKFEEFSIELDYDVLYIGTSPDDHDTLERFTGRLTPEPIFLEEETFFAAFSSDSSKNVGVVTLKVTVVNLTEVFTCPKGNRLHSKQLCDGLWNCPDGSDEVDCDPLPVHANKSVVTPRFPLPYENNADVTWTFAAEEGLRMVFVPYIFYTEEGYDKLTFGSGRSCQESYSSELSGYHGPDKPVVSEDNTLCVHFSSDQSITAHGVYAHVYAVAEEDIIECPENGKAIVGEYVCDGIWQCPETGADERDCPPYHLGMVIPFGSPGYPYPYPQNTTQITSASWPEGTAVVFEFTAFDLEEGVDFLTIGCGNDPSDESSIVATLTGSEIPDPLYVGCQRGWTKFVSDGVGDNAGFESYISVVAVNSTYIVECPENGEAVVGADICDGIWQCPETGADERDCPPYHLGMVIPFGSPGYPYPYPQSTTQITSASWPEGTAVVFEFTVFDLEEGVDFLTIGCGNDPSDESSIVATLTGSEIPDPVYVGCQRGWTKFVSDGEGYNAGFKSYISVVAVNSTYNPCRQPPMGGTPDDICAFFKACHPGNATKLTCTVVGETPQPVYSPGYPDLYNDSLQLTDVFVVPRGYRPVLNVTDFATETGFDFLNVSGFRHPEIALLSGNDIELPFVIASPTHAIILQFVSDGSLADRGYSGYVYAVAEEELVICENGSIPAKEDLCNNRWDCSDGADEMYCDNLFEVGSTVSLTSPGYPDNYPHDQTVVWAFQGEPLSRFVVDVIDLRLEEDFDFLYIGYEESDNVLAELTGTVKPREPIVTPGNHLWVAFSSDSSFSMEGFALNISVIAADVPINIADTTCAAYLPYTEARAGSVFEPRVPLDRERLALVIFASCEEALLPAVCWALYPPAYPNDHPFSLCYDACLSLSTSQCSNVNAVLNVQCDRFEGYEEPIGDGANIPGLCDGGYYWF